LAKAGEDHFGFRWMDVDQFVITGEDRHARSAERESPRTSFAR